MLEKFNSLNVHDHIIFRASGLQQTPYARDMLPMHS